MQDIDIAGRSETIEAAEVLAERASKYFSVADDAQASLVGEFRAQLNAKIKDLDAERLDMGSGLRASLEKINAKYNGKITELKSILSRVDAGLRTYLVEQRRRAEEAERERVEAERRAREDQAAAEAQAAEAGVEPPPPVVFEAPPPVETKITGTMGSRVSTRDVWKWRITDIKKVPEQYLVAPEDRVQKSVLNALAKSQKENARVKGIEFYCEDTITSRVVR